MTLLFRPLQGLYNTMARAVLLPAVRPSAQVASLACPRLLSYQARRPAASALCGGVARTRAIPCTHIPGVAPVRMNSWRSMLRRTGKAGKIPALEDAAAHQAVNVASQRTIRGLVLRKLDELVRRHAVKLGVLGGTVAIVGLWKLTFALTAVFVDFAEWFAELGFFFFAAATVGSLAVIMWNRSAINPESVFRRSLRLLTEEPAVREVLGDKIETSSLRAVVFSGGNLKMSKTGLPKLRSKRIHMVYPVTGEFAATGEQRSAIVSVEATKKRGKYNFKLLAVDIPSQDALLILQGEPERYESQITLELRDPLLQSISQEPVLELEEEVEEELEQIEAQKEREEAAAAKEKAKAAENELANASTTDDPGHVQHSHSPTNAQQVTKDKSSP